eukprot:5959890-Amphidinium_carterae.1
MAYLAHRSAKIAAGIVTYSLPHSGPYASNALRPRWVAGQCVALNVLFNNSAGYPLVSAMTIHPMLISPYVAPLDPASQGIFASQHLSTQLLETYNAETSLDEMGLRLLHGAALCYAHA